MVLKLDSNIDSDINNAQPGPKLQEKGLFSIKRGLLWAALLIILLSIILSIIGAFLGAERAKRFFNSIPLGIYWCTFVILLTVGIVVFKRLLRMPLLLMIHLGCIFVILGGMWGSDKGHQFRSSVFGINKIPSGRMAVYKGSGNNRVFLADGNDPELIPFDIKLNDFRIEYYEPAYLYIYERASEQKWKVPAVAGTEVDIGDGPAKIKFINTYNNFKINITESGNVPYDSTEPGLNPAVEIELDIPGRQTQASYIFENFPDNGSPDDPFIFRYGKIVSDYISDVEIVKDGKVIAQKEIEFNYPLHINGYHIYQNNYGVSGGRWYSVFNIVSDDGLYLVFLGYLLLCVGVFGNLWFKKIPTIIKR